jgi:hypothetical protein
MITNQNRSSASLLRLDKLSVAVCVAFTALAVFTLPSSLQGAEAGLDPSWVLGLHLAAANGLVYGRDILFSYGPLGFLMFPLLVSTWLWFFAVIVRDLVHIAFFLSLAVFALRSENRLVNAIMLGVSAPIIEPFLGTAYTLGVVILVMSYLAVCSAKRAYLVLLSVVAALSFYIKADIGILSLAIMLVATTWAYLRQPFWKSLPPLLIYAGSLTVAGLILTRSPGILLSFLLGYLQLVAGYGNAMSIDLMPFWFILFPLLASLAIVTLITKRSSVRSRLFFALSIPFLFITYKEGFVREDLHVLIFFAAWSLFCLLFQAVTAHSPRKRAKIIAIGLAVILLGSGVELWGMTFLHSNSSSPIVFAANISEFVEAVYAPSRLQSVSQDLQLVAQQRRAQAIYNDTVVAARSAYPLSNKTLAIFHGHTVDVLPWDVSLAYVYGLQWDPAPIFQSYSAYTPYLDEVNARHYTSLGSPDFVLYKFETIDGRYPLFDEPLALMTLACNYKLVGNDSQFFILQRNGNACSSSELMSVQEVSFGQPVQVPISQAPVTARVFLENSWLGVVSGLAYKIPDATINLQYGNGQSENHRLVVATAADGLLLRPGFLSASIPAPSVDQITFLTNGPQYYSSTIRVEFYKILTGTGLDLNHSEGKSLQYISPGGVKTLGSSLNPHLHVRKDGPAPELAYSLADKYDVWDLFGASDFARAQYRRFGIAK